jgi:hypothetical protein
MTLASGLVATCDDPELFGVELTPAQREFLAEVERGGLLHCWALGRGWGKTLLATLVALWFCLLRPDLAAHVRRRERRYAVSVATSQRQAAIFVELGRSVVEPSALLAPLIESVTESVSQRGADRDERDPGERSDAWKLGPVGVARVVGSWCSEIEEAGGCMPRLLQSTFTIDSNRRP